ncbi:MAG: signal peptidase II [Clostridia bacterium]|nr:signal peptidase II [Clostridia bacterium]
MKHKNLIKKLVHAVAILLIIGLDQLTKMLAVSLLKPIDTFPILKNVLHLTYVENRGAAFGMLSNSRWVFMIISTLAILVMLVFLFSGKVPLIYEIPLIFMAAGGLGNMIDRIALGYVVDFIDFRLINFAVFNGADSFVCVGSVLLVIAMIFDVDRENRKKKETKDTKNDN